MAISCYLRSITPGAPKQAIIAQNDYKRHTREFFELHQDATQDQAIAAWWAKRNAPRSGK
jgi:hypothetical protein